jgi:hypothetical protein
MSVQPPNPCRLLTTDEVAQALQGLVRDQSGGELADGGDGSERSCFWSVGQQGLLTVMVLTQKQLNASFAAVHRFDRSSPASAPPIAGWLQGLGQPVPGLGDSSKLWIAPNGDPVVRVLDGSTFLQIDSVNRHLGDGGASVVHLARAAVGRLTTVGP